MLQIRTILALEEAFPVLRRYSRILEKTLYDSHRNWFDWIRGSKDLERREARINEWKNKGDIDQLLGRDNVRSSALSKTTDIIYYSIEIYFICLGHLCHNHNIVYNHCYAQSIISYCNFVTNIVASLFTD